MVKLILPKKPIVSSQYELYLTSEKQLLEEYFKKVAEFISNMGYDSFSKILEGFTISGEKSYSENKDLMNNELENFYNITKKNIYFIALTNDVSPKKGLKEMEDDYCPPLTLTLKNGTCNEFVNNKSNFGILTYRELVANDVVKYDEKEKERNC